MSYVEAMVDVLADPEADAPRERVRDSIVDSDPTRAEFIHIQLEKARRRRQGRGVWGGMTMREADLEFENHRRWEEDISMFMGELPRDRHVEFDRGFVRCMSMNPYVFLEHGQYVMTRVAPIRGIWFFPDPEGAPFPMRELAASPLLARLDDIKMSRCGLTDEDVEVFAASPHLTRLCWLDVSHNPAGHRGIEALAANARTRSCLRIEMEGLVEYTEGVPNEHIDPDGYGDYDYWDMSDFGYALERKYGHVPWLHPIENACYVADARYWIDQRRLPVHAPGSPAEQPTPIGSPLRSVPRNPKRKRFDGWWRAGA